MNCEKVVARIVDWLVDQANKTGRNGFVVGVSGGIDSAVVSTLCAMTDLPTTAISMPIFQNKQHHDRSLEHLNWLWKKYSHVVENVEIDLASAFQALCDGVRTSRRWSRSNESSLDILSNDLVNANARSRLRMTTLYAYANARSAFVVGTGNKVEDHGVGFFTKYGDGGVDISPIGDLTKTEVFELGAYLGNCESILNAAPSDGLWDDARTDEEQIGATYEELEWAMVAHDSEYPHANELTDRQKEVEAIYLKWHNGNAHKMKMPPVCKISRYTRL